MDLGSAFSSLVSSSTVTYATFARLDDCLQTCDRIPRLTSVLQLPRHGYYGWRCRVPSQVEGRALYVLRLRHT